MGWSFLLVLFVILNINCHAARFSNIVTILISSPISILVYFLYYSCQPLIKWRNDILLRQYELLEKTAFPLICVLVKSVQTLICIL